MGLGGVLPRDFVDAHGVAEAFDAFGEQFIAGGGQFRRVAEEMIVGGIADDDAAAAGMAFEPAGKVDFAAKDGVIQDMLVRTHQADGDQAGVDAGAQLQGDMQGLGRQAGGWRRAIFDFARGVLRLPLLVQGIDGALGVNRRARRRPRRAVRSAWAHSKRPSRSRQCICRACRHDF